MPKPYIGITGVTTIREVSDVSREFYEAGYTMNSHHLPTLGYLISYKTLNEQETNNKRYPNFKILRDLLMPVKSRAFTMIHYNTRETQSLSEQVEKIFYNLYNDELCRALQLNIPWPDIKQLKSIKTRFPEMQIVFQASNDVLNGLSVEEAVSKIRDYGSLIDHVLLDASKGQGIEFNMEDSLNVYKEIREKLSRLIVGFAGGFNPENVLRRIEHLIKETKSTYFNIDTESGLRDKLSDNYGDDLLNINKVRRYLRKVSSVLK